MTHLPMKNLSIATIALGVLLIVIKPAGAQPSSLPSQFTYSHGIAPRMQWNENSGYCGETSFISAGMHFGQYCSQFTAREIASPGINQADPASQLLVGVNDTYAARKMRLQAAEFYSAAQSSVRDFLRWTKSNTLAGNVVVMGVFNNGILLEEWTCRTDGDSEFDHIVPVLGWGSNASLEDYSSEYIAGDVITISDNGLYGPFGAPPEYQFLYSYHLRKFTGNRVQANNPNGPVYLLKNQPQSYAIAIGGVLDLDEVTLPVRLTSDKNYEPEIGVGSNLPPPPIPITLTATVTISNQSAAHVLYRYDNFDKVPVAGFNAAAANAVESWEIPPNSGPAFVVELQTLSNATAVFRAVPADAP